MKRLFMAAGIAVTILTLMGAALAGPVLGAWLVGSPWGALLPVGVCVLVAAWFMAGDEMGA